MEHCDNSSIPFNVTDVSRAAGFLYTSYDKWIIYVIVPIISVVGVSGNSAFLFMAFRVTELRKAIVTYYMISLAVCDILFLLSTSGWYVASLVSSPVNLAFPVHSTFGCAFWVISTHWWYLASLGLVTLISVERYFAICKPVKHRNFKYALRHRNVIILIWMTTLIITLTAIPQYGRLETNCMIWPDKENFTHLPKSIDRCVPVNEVANIYAHLIAKGVLIVAVLVNIGLYAKIIAALRKYRNKRSTLVTERIRTQVTRTLVINGIIFFICQFPYRVFTLHDVLESLTTDFELLESHKTESTVQLVGRVFLFLNSTINPFLYIMCCQHYRESMRKAFFGDRPRTEIGDFEDTYETSDQPPNQQTPVNNRDTKTVITPNRPDVVSMTTICTLPRDYQFGDKLELPGDREDLSKERPLSAISIYTV